jgi:hypothetical protein
MQGSEGVGDPPSLRISYSFLLLLTVTIFCLFRNSSPLSSLLSPPETEAETERRSASQRILISSSGSVSGGLERGLERGVLIRRTGESE